MRCQRETKLKFFDPRWLAGLVWVCVIPLEQSWEKVVGRINEKGGLGPRILNFRYEIREKSNATGSDETE